MKIIITISVIIFTQIAYSSGGGTAGGGPRLNALMINNLDIETSLIKFNKEEIQDIQFSNGILISPKKAALLSKDINIIKERLLINMNSKEIFDVQMKNGKTCVIPDYSCY